MAGTTNTLESVIQNYLIEKGEDTEHGWKRYLQLAINGLKEMDYDVSGQPKYLTVKLDNTHSIPIPDDSVRIISVLFNDNGKLVKGARDNETPITVDASCGVDNTAINEVSNESDYTTSESVTNHYTNGSNTGGYYNMRGGNIYTFRENDQMGIIELSTNFPSTVILEYLPTSKRVNGKFMIHPYLLEPLLAWLRYADVRSKRNVSGNEKFMLQRDYVNKKTQAAVRLNSFTEDDFLHALRSSYTASFKF